MTSLYDINPIWNLLPQVPIMGDMHTSACLHCHRTPWTYKNTGNAVTHQMYLKVWHGDKHMGCQKTGGGGGGGGKERSDLNF